MTQQDKDLLLRDLSTRLPCGAKCQTKNGIGTLISIECSFGENLAYVDFGRSEAEEYDLNDEDTVKPYLRPMSSMTEKEANDWHEIALGQRWITFDNVERCADWLISHHFDFRDLIEKGLALEAKEGMYNKN